MGLEIPREISLPNRWSGILDLQAKDTYRDGQVVKLSNVFQRVIFFFSELFSGGRTKNDHANFNHFYTDISKQITALSERLDNTPDDAAFLMVQTMLKVQARVAISGWGASDQDYAAFEQQMSELQTKAQATIGQWDVAVLADHARSDISRWINANALQRNFAASVNGEIPFKWEEIPKGAVILYNPDSWTLSHKLQNHTLSFGQLIKSIKTVFCKLFTGKVYTHAELSLGNGYTFDLDKKEGTLCAGIAKIQDRRGKICFYDVIVPNQEKMVEAHNTANPESPVESYDALWEQIENEARTKHDQVRASFTDILRVALSAKRPENYDCRAAWNPGCNNYGCSATVSALFGKYGIDIGRQFEKMDQNVSPANLGQSEFFRPSYVLA